MENKIAYISGPISGLKNGNYENFMLAQKILEKQDFIVINPHEISNHIYEKWAKIPEPENKKDLQEYENERWKEFMKNDIKYLLTCTHVFVLDNYETSRGALLEILIAQKLGLKIYKIKIQPNLIDFDFIDFDIHFEIQKYPKITVV